MGHPLVTAFDLPWTSVAPASRAPRRVVLVVAAAASLCACGGGGSGPAAAGTPGTSTDTTPPTLSISSPSTAGTYATSSPTITVSGIAADNVSVAKIGWASSLGSSGDAAGTTSWQASGIALQPGPNVLTFKATDAAGNIATSTLSVTYTASSGLPAAGSYVRPGSVGFLGDESALAQYLDGGAAPAGCSWQSYGLRCDQTDLVLDHVHIRGGLYWTGTGNLTITNSVVEGGDAWYAVYAAAAANGATATMTIRDSTLRWTSGLAMPAGSDVGPFWTRGTQALVVQRCDISGMPQGLDPGAGSVIEDNWIHDLFQNNPSDNPTHLDGVFSQGGGDIVILRNYIDVPARSDTTAAVFIQDRGGTDSGIRIYGNYLSGGAYVLRNQTGIAVDVVNNTFGSSLYGDVGDLAGYPGTYGAWSGNVHADGTPVDRP